MNDIKRYDIIGEYESDMVPIQAGDYCLYTDVAPIIAERDALVEGTHVWHKKVRDAEKQREYLRELLARIRDGATTEIDGDLLDEIDAILEVK